MISTRPTWAYSPRPRRWGKKANVAGQRLELTKTVAGTRVTLTSVYAEERRVIVGYEVEDLEGKRQVAGHPAELQPLLGFGYGKPTPREGKYLEKYDLGTDVVALTDQSDVQFRMVDNSGEVSEGPDDIARGPLHNMVAFEPEVGLEPGEGHRFRLEIPLVEEALGPLEEQRLPPEPFPGTPFAFVFEIPVRPDPVVEAGQKETPTGTTLTPERVTDSPIRGLVCERHRRAGRIHGCLPAWSPSPG
jgi:hypothetical protein